MPPGRKRTSLGDITNNNIVKDGTNAKRRKIEILSDVKLDIPSEPAPTLDTIPKEIIGSIFNMLDHNDKLNLAATNKRMNECFTSYFSFTLDLDTNDLPEITRPYAKVTFKNLTKPKIQQRMEQIISLIKTMGPHIKELIFENAKVTEKFFSGMLHFCPNVKSLNFYNFKICGSDYSASLPFSHLEQIFFDDSTSVYNLRNILAKVKTLQQFKSGNYSNEEDEENAFKENTAISEILARQPNLKKLRIICNEIFKNGFQNRTYPFQLKTFMISIGELSKLQSQNMSSFVLQQKELKKVSFNVRCDYKSNNFIRTFQHILLSPELKSLSLVFYELSTMKAFYRDCEIINPSVEELYLGVCKMKRSYRRFIQSTSTNFPNLKSLTIKFDDDWYNTRPKTYTALNSLTKLETLKLEIFHIDFLQNLAIPSLKSLQIFTLAEFDNEMFVAFLMKHQQLINCCIALDEVNIHSTIQLIESQVMNLPKLATVTVCKRGGTIPAFVMTDLLDFIKQNSSSIRQMKVCDKIYNF